MRRGISGLILLVLTIALVGCSSKSLTVKDLWARQATAGENGGAYFTIDNPTNQADTLLGVSSPAAQTSEMHMTMVGSDGVMSMTPQESVPVPAKGTTEFKPGGLHVMMINLQRDLNAGDTVSLTLKFEKAGEITVNGTVREP